MDPEIASSPAECRQRALKLLARRSHFRRELEVKLRKKGFEEEAVAAALERLSADGVLDDAETAREFARFKLSRGPLGRPKLTAELARKGADPDLAREVAAEMTDDDDGDAAEASADRWLGRRLADPGTVGDFPPLDEPDRAALARHLERKGFSRRAIFRVLDRHPAPPRPRSTPDIT
jgi:regulatory protein